MSDPSYLILNVGGFQYQIDRSMLLKFPDSFFDKMLNSEWKESSASSVEIQRDGKLFKHVYDYMFYGKLPRNEIGLSLCDASLLKEVMQEADFYSLPGLVTECGELLNTCEAEQCVKQYVTVLDEIDEAKSNIHYRRSTVVYKSTGPDSLLALLRSNPFASAWVSGTLNKNCDPNVFVSTTVQNVNVPELIAAAQPSPFGRGSETVMDKNVRDSLEIPANKLCNLTKIIKNIDISSLAPNMKLTLKPYKLVVYQEGGHFDSHRDTVRDEHHVGTLVLILNSEYTGGELEVSHGEHNLVVAGALKWVAMYGDCVHTIRPVTSGTRVSLIFDIWNESDEVVTSAKRKPPKSNYRNKRIRSEEEELEDYYQNEFWPEDRIRKDYWLSKGATKEKVDDDEEDDDDEKEEELKTTSNETLETTSMDTPTVGIDIVWNRIYAALDKELEKHKTVSICLEHLYPACQANPNFLKGKDANLYQMLKDKYSLGVTAISIARAKSEDDGDSIGYSEFGSKQLIDEEENTLLVPNALNSNSVLYYMPGSEYTGNESQDTELVYLVAALVVRKQ